MPRRSKNHLSGTNELIYRISILAGLLGFIGSFYWIPLPAERASESFLIAVAFAVGAMFITVVILILIKSAFSPRKSVELTFDEPPRTTAHRNKAASEFEYEVASMINQLTGKKTQVVGGAGDGGVDIKVYDDNMRLVGIVQCKNFAANKTISPSYIRELNSVKHYHQVNTAYLVTTGKFSRDSQDLAKKLGVRLIDGEALRSLRKQVIQSKGRNSSS